MPKAEPEFTAYAATLDAALSRGIVGVTDFEFGAGWREWPQRFAAGLDRLRVRVACYPDELSAVLAAGLRTGDRLDPSGRLEMGPFKIIYDGSLGSRSAWCSEPYADHDPASCAAAAGQPNHSDAELAELLRRAAVGGLQVAVHAIGDRAVHSALDVIEATGARGTIEHAQLVRTADLARMARLGVIASVQPAHLLDDRDNAEVMWADRTDRCFRFGSMMAAGIALRFGSDAPVVPLDPWLAMAAAVHRSADDRPPWHPEEAVDARAALLSSTGAVGAIRPGGRADLILLDDDPLVGGNSAAVAARLRTMSVALTVVDGSPVAGELASR